MSSSAMSGSRRHDILHLGRPVFGPVCDALVRDIAPRLPESRRADFAALVETWPLDAGGRPLDHDALLRRLMAFRDEPGRAGSGRRRRRGRRNAGSAALFGAVLAGGVLGLPLGLLVWALLRHALLSHGIAAQEDAAYGVVLVVTLPVALLGLMQGAAPGRTGHAALVGAAGFLLGALASGMLAGLGGLAVAPPPEAGLDAEELIAQARRAEEAMEWVPLAALLGGSVLGPLAAFRGWRRWRPWGGSSREARADGAGRPGRLGAAGGMAGTSESSW